MNTTTAVRLRPTKASVYFPDARGPCGQVGEPVLLSIRSCKLRIVGTSGANDQPIPQLLEKLNNYLWIKQALEIAYSFSL